ncbi:MAG: YeeE/YedE family protein [Spirochaetales bacterium]|nr:YeeE/YedE family protein [Spirochaetales bacterium]
MSDTPTIPRSSGSIPRSSSRSKKPKKSQIPYAFVVLAVITLVGILLALQSSQLGFFWVTGCIFGFILQRSRFCFTAAMRDPYLTGGTSLSRAVLIAFAVATLGFAAIKYAFFLRGLPMPGESFVVPISFATIAGAFMFGIGMVIAGGCASGTFMRIGEGFTMQMLAVVFFIIGSFWGARDMGWWTEKFIVHGPRVFLPDVFGWLGAVVVQLVFIAVLYILATKWENRKNEL